MLLPKLYYYRKNNTHIKNLVNKLKSFSFLPQNAEEEKFVLTAMKRTTFFHRLLLSLTYPTIVMWSISAYIGHKDNSEKQFLIPANFPFDIKVPSLYYFALFYQTIAIFYTGTTHMTTDTMATGLIFHAASQVEILGSRISKIGYFAGQEELQDKMTPKLKMYLNKKFYNDLIAQIKHHKEIIEFCKEIQDAFKEALFVQLITTCFILCMTELQMVVLLQQSLILFANSLPYFIILALQIYLLCYCGNELTYAVTFFYCVTE
uniref:CSON003796 protein n=1 Tax=Culicoides sonorensis TaxID=179676 RepID=A0A336L2D1_CULSO